MEKKYTITLRLSYDQFAWLGALCRRSKQTQSAVIRSLIESGTVRERITKEHIHIIRQLIGESTNLNQLAKQANTYGFFAVAERCEEIDLSVNHEFFGIEKTTKNQREKLRKKARRYFLDTVSAELDENLKKLGVEGYHIENVVEEIDEDGKASPVASDKDPSVILVHYESMLGHTIEYIPPRVKIEISCLSMNEPTEDRLISSYIEQTFPGEDAAATATVRTVVPTRTFLEKAFLLCEEFQKQTPRHVRMSRHLYDLERLMDTGFGKQALQDIDLYERIVKHRSIYYAVGYVDYSKLMPSEIDFVPRQELMKDWEGDYAEMCNHFIYGQTLSFEKLLERIKELQDRFRKAF